MNVNGRVAVVTGGASGIGLTLCTRFAKEGADVVLADLDQEACNRHAEPIGALPVAADVAREEAVGSLVSATIEHFGRVDLLVSNAGIAIDGGIETPTCAWQKIIGVRVLCPAAVRTPILDGREGTQEARGAISTEEVADIVVEGLAQERFNRFAVKGRDYDEYIAMVRAGRLAETARTAGQA